MPHYDFSDFPTNCTPEEMEIIKSKLEVVSVIAEEHLKYMEDADQDSVEFIEYDLVAIEEAFLFLYSFWLSKQEKQRTLN